MHLSVFWADDHGVKEYLERPLSEKLNKFFALVLSVEKTMENPMLEQSFLGFLKGYVKLKWFNLMVMQQNKW